MYTNNSFIPKACPTLNRVGRQSKGISRLYLLIAFTANCDKKQWGMTVLRLISQMRKFRREKKNNVSMLYTSVLSMILCIVCLIGSSWAWFTANQSVEVGTISAAEWTIDSLEVHLSTEDGESVRIEKKDKVFHFQADANKKYVVTASVKGTSSTGFMLVKTCDGVFYTLDKNSTFTILPSKDGTVTISASWGTETGPAEYFADGDALGEGKEDVAEEVAEEEVAEEVAEEEAETEVEEEVKPEAEQKPEAEHEKETEYDLGESHITDKEESSTNL